VEEIEIHHFWDFGSVPNLNELGIGPLTSLIGFALGQVKKVHGKCSLLKNVSLRTTSRGILKNSTLFGIYFKELPCGLFGLKRMILVFNKHYWFVH